MRQHEKIEELLRASSLFSMLPDADLKRYGPLFHSRQYDAGESLYGEGKLADSLYLIRRGRVKVTRASADGKEMIIGFFGRGDFVGCCCVLNATRFPCTAQAAEPTEALCLSREAFLGIMRQHPDLAICALQEVTQRLRGAHDRMKNLALDPVERRVVAALLELDERFGTTTQNGARLLRTRVTRLELAQMAGTTLETASRTMSKLKRAGSIRSSRDGILLLSPQALARHLA
jgi:CRP-like cAMP-binding protein